MKISKISLFISGISLIIIGLIFGFLLLVLFVSTIVIPLSDAYQVMYANLSKDIYIIVNYGLFFLGAYLSSYFLNKALKFFSNRSIILFAAFDTLLWGLIVLLLQDWWFVN